MPDAPLEGYLREGVPLGDREPDPHAHDRLALETRQQARVRPQHADVELPGLDGREHPVGIHLLNDKRHAGVRRGVRLEEALGQPGVAPCDEGNRELPIAGSPVRQGRVFPLELGKRLFQAGRVAQELEPEVGRDQSRTLSAEQRLSNLAVDATHCLGHRLVGDAEHVRRLVVALRRRHGHHYLHIANVHPRPPSAMPVG